MISKKKAQLFGLPFSVIFSIILIAVFIVVAVIAINYFLNFKKCSSQATFKQDLQENIDETWQSSQAENVAVSLPEGSSYVCFADAAKPGKGLNSNFYGNLLPSENYNLYLYPASGACSGFKQMKILHINISEITAERNPYCIKNDGKNKITLNKNYYESLVRIS